MVNPNLSEEEQVEALKKWWQENGKSVIGGVVLGLGAVFGWKYWVEHQETLSNQASMRFELLNQSLQTAAVDSAGAQADALIKEYPGSIYAAFAALSLAKLRYEEGDAAGAIAQLNWAGDNVNDQSLKQIIRVRLARIMLSEGQLEAAAQQVAAAERDGFQGEFAELRGDIASAGGDLDAARAAYREALEFQVGDPALVQMKLDDLPANL